jgi:Domain of unknown function (DUF4190)
MAEVTSTYCGAIPGDRVQIPGLMTLKYVYPALFFTDAILLTRPARTISVAWGAAQLADVVLGYIIPGGGAGLLVRPFRRHDFFKVTEIFTDLTRDGGAELTSTKASAALNNYVNVIRTSRVTRLHIADSDSSHQNVCFRMYYGIGIKSEFIVKKPASATVTNMFRNTFGKRFDTLLAEPGTSSMAVSSMVLAALGIFTGGLTAIPAVIFGHIARRQMKLTGQHGDGLATGGLVLGYMAIIIYSVLIAVYH